MVVLAPGQTVWESLTSAYGLTDSIRQPVCSATRAPLLTGWNHHMNNMVRFVQAWPTPTEPPGWDGQKACQRAGIADHHSITLSACTNNAGGILTPSASAVLRFTTNLAVSWALSLRLRPHPTASACLAAKKFGPPTSAPGIQCPPCAKKRRGTKAGMMSGRTPSQRPDVGQLDCQPLR